MTITSIQRISMRTYRYTVSGTAPFRVYRAGNLETETSATTIDIQSDSNDMPPYVEILDADDTDDPIQLRFPATFRIQWRGVPGCVTYRVTDPNGDPVAAMPEDGRGYYAFQSTALPSGVEAVYTVTAYDQAGVSLGALTVTACPVALDEPEAYTHTVSAGVLTVGVA